HPRENRAKARRADDREEAAILLAGASHGRGVANEIGAILKEPRTPFVKTRQTLEQLRIDRLDREQWNEPDHRADANVGLAAVRQTQKVVIEIVVVVPQVSVVLADRCRAIVDGVRDVKEVLEEFR